MQKEWLNLSYYGLRLFVHQRALFVIGNTDDPAKQEVLTGLGFSEIPQMRHPERGAYWRLPPELANNSALHGLAKGFPHARIELTPVSEVVPGSSVAPRSQLENTHANRQQQLHNSETGAANAPQPAVARAAGSAQQDSDRPDTGQRGSAVHPDSRPDNRGRDEAVPVVEDGTPDHQRAESAQDAGNQQAGGDSLSGLPGEHSGPLPGTRAAAGVPVAGEQPDAARGDASQLDESIQTGGQGNLDQRSGQRADLTQAFSQYLAARLAQFESLDDQESETRAAELQAAIQSPYRPDASSPLAVLSHPAFAAAQADSLTGPDALAAIAPDEHFDEQAIAQAWAVVEQAKASLPPLSEMEIMLGQQRTGANLFAQALKDHDPQLAADLESAVTRAEFVVQSNLAAAQETAMLAHLQQPEQPAESPQASELVQPGATEEPEQTPEQEQTPEPEVDPGDQMAIHITASEPVPEPLIREYFGLAEEQPLVVPFSAVKSFMVQYFQIPDADCMERLGDAVHQPLDDPAGLTYVVDVSELHTVLAPAPVAGAEQTQQEQPEFEPETAAEQEAEQAQSEPETKREAEAEPEVEPETVEYAPVPNIVIDGPVTSAKVGQAIRQGWELYAEAGWEYGEVYPIVLSVGEQRRYMMVSTTDKTNDTKALSAYSLAPSAVIGDNLLSMDRFDVSRNDGVVREPTYLAYRPEVADDWRECFERVGFPVFTEEMLTNPGLYFEEHWHSQVKAPLVSPEEFAKHIADISSRAATESMEPPAPAPEWSEQDQQQTDLFAEPAPAEETPDVVELPKSVQVNIAGDLHSEVFGVLEAEAAEFRAALAQMDEDDDDYNSLGFAIDDLPKAEYALRRDVEDGVLSRFASYKDDYVKTYEALEAGIGRQAQLLAAAAQEQMAHVDGERSFVRALYTGISNPHDLFALQAQAEASGLKAKGSINDLLVAGALAHTVVNSAEYTDALQRETAMDRSLVEAMSYVESGIQMAMVGADGQTITNMEAQQIPDFLPAGMWIRQPEEMGRQERWLQIVPADRDSAEHVHYKWHWMTSYEDGRPNWLNIYAAGLLNRDADNPAKGVGQWLYLNTLQGHRALQGQANRLMDGYVGRLGTNAEGGSVRVDENGVRFYYEDGFRVSEPVAVDMGGTGASRPKQSREGTGYETTVEIAYREERAQQARETQEAQQAEANQPEPETETAQETGTGEVNYQYAADNPQLGGMYEHAVIDDNNMPTNVNRVWLADQPVTVAQGERIVDSKVVVAPTVLTKHDREMIDAPGLPGEVKAWRATIVDGEQGLRCLFEAEVSTHNYDRDNNVLRSAFALVDSELGYLAKKVPALFIEADHMLAQAREVMAEGERLESQALFEQAEPELEQAPAEPATNEPQDAPAPAGPQAETLTLAGLDLPQDWVGELAIKGYAERDNEIYPASDNSASFWSLVALRPGAPDYWLEDFDGANGKQNAEIKLASVLSEHFKALHPEAWASATELMCLAQYPDVLGGVNEQSRLVLQSDVLGLANRNSLLVDRFGIPLHDAHQINRLVQGGELRPLSEDEVIQLLYGYLDLSGTIDRVIEEANENEKAAELAAQKRADEAQEQREASTKERAQAATEASAIADEATTFASADTDTTSAGADSEPTQAPEPLPEAQPVQQAAPAPVEEEHIAVPWSGVRREHLVEAAEWSKSGLSTQIAALKQIEADGIHTDAEDLSVIIRALQFNEGWGAFTVGANRWVTQQAAHELDMSEAEFSRYVVEHRNESYYTQLPMVDAMWKVVEKAGIPTNSRILEPACGAGIFVAGAPAEYQDNARFLMIDKDRVATRFAQALLPQATVINDRLEATLFERNFGAVISNVPFGQTRITDNEYNDKPYVHDYFIRRAVNALEPGGVAVLVTSRGFMDRASPDVRQDVMATSDLIGAVRLPDNMFASAGAQVVTDILVFQKRKPGCTPLRDFTQVEEISRSFGDESITMRVNSFFAQHPENVLGELSIRSGPYGDEPTIEANMDYHEIYAALEERLGEQVSEGIYEAARNRVPDLVEEADQVGVQSWDSNAYPAADTHADDLVVGQYMLDNDVPVEVVGFKPSYDQNGVQSGVSPLVSRLTLGQRQERLVRAFIPLRDAAIELAKAQVGGTDEQLAAAQAEALALYESFVKSFGPVNASNNYRIIGEDPTGSEVLSLETYDPKERVVVSLADTFTKRVIGSNHQTGKVQTAEDAYWASMDRIGTADFELMEELSGLSQDDLKAELVGRFVFLNPESREFESEDVYLSGNVVQKLDMAVKAAELDPDFKVNVMALERVRPQLKAFDDIFYNLGSNWIPADMVRDWVLDQAGSPGASDHDFKVVYDDHTGSWDVVASTSFRNRNKVLFDSTFGTPRAHMGALLKHALSGTAPTFRMKDEEGKDVVDMELTQQAADMIKVINSSFKEWVAQDGGRREQIEELYNNKINVFAVPKYNGDHLTFPGLAEGWVPRKHQVDFISRMLRGYNCGSGHPVGAGKTLEMVAGAMKLKQSGQFNKPVAAIPNHMLQQFTREAKMLYPSAKILMVTRQDLSADNRARFLSVTRNNDWDLVVMTHSMVNEMMAPIDIQLENTREQLDVVGVHMEAAIAQGDKRAQKRLADRKSTLEAQITAIEAENKRLERGESKSRRMFIAETGIDCLLIDEAHAYKNLNLNTGLDVLGINKGGSKRALNMEQLASYMRSVHGGQSKGVFYFTGTPITNTMAEGYVMVKYLRPDYWESIGCKHFDSWMKNFGVIESQVEILVEGSQVGVRQRATSFDGSFRPIFHEVWDIKLPEELGLPTPDVEYEMVEVQPTKLQEKFQDHLAIRATAIRDRKVDPTEDNLLVVSMDGSKGAIDLQLIDPRIPDELSGNKLDVAAQRIKGFWEDTHEQKGTQLVFLDLGVYKGPNEFSLYSKLRDKLVEQGIPAEEVAFIHEAGSSAKKKEDIFAKVRSGEIRVLVGSSEKMGVGTNIQDRLIALHSLDVPWRPDITTQRNGRINRQGNLFFEKVHILNYIAHNSSEAGRAQKNKYKYEMQRQALRNEDYATDVIFDENNEISYEEWMAAATGEPKIAEHAQVQAEYESMCRSKGVWERQQSFLRTTKLDFERSLNRIEREIEQAQRVQQGLPHASMQIVEVRGEVVGIQDGDTSWFSTGGYDKNQGLAAALKRRVETTITQLMRSGGQNSRELGVSVGAVEFHVRPHAFHRGVYNLIGFTGEDVVPNLVSEITKESMTTGLALANRTRKTWEAAGWVKEYENQRVDIQARLENLAEPATEWPKEAELERLGERYQELSEWMQKNDFSGRYREMQDPFLEYMRALDATCAQELSDHLETDLQTSNGETLEPDDAIIEVEQYHHTEESDGALVLDDAMLIDTNLEQTQDSSLGVKQAPPTPGLSVG